MANGHVSSEYVMLVVLDEMSEEKAQTESRCTAVIRDEPRGERAAAPRQDNRRVRSCAIVNDRLNP
jgi:hypothetical protein